MNVRSSWTDALQEQQLEKHAPSGETWLGSLEKEFKSYNSGRTSLKQTR